MGYESLKLSRDAFVEATWLAAEIKSLGKILDAYCWTEDADEAGWRKLVIEATSGGARCRTEQLCRPVPGALLDAPWPKRRVDALGLVRIAGAVDGKEVELHADGDRLLVSARRAKYSLKLTGLDEDAPPAWPRKADAYHTLPAPDLARVLGRTRFAIDRRGSARWAVEASALELLPKAVCAVGTDGTRLAADEVEAKPVGGHKKPAPLLIFPEAARLVDQLCQRGGEVHIWENGNRAVFALRQHTLMLPTVEGRYPPWRDMAMKWGEDSTGGEFTIHAGDLAKAVAIGAICCDRNNLAVVLTLSSIGLLVGADRSTNGESWHSLPSVGYQGDDVVVYLDHRPLRKWLALVKPDEMLRVVLKEDVFRATSEDGSQYVQATLSREEIDEKNAEAPVDAEDLVAVAD